MTDPVSLAEIEQMYDGDVLAMVEALRIAVEALEWATPQRGFGHQLEDALAAVRELVDLGEKP